MMMMFAFRSALSKTLGKIFGKARSRPRLTSWLTTFSTRKTVTGRRADIFCEHVDRQCYHVFSNVKVLLDNVLPHECSLNGQTAFGFDTVSEVSIFDSRVGYLSLRLWSSTPSN
jgi:hypothetical protein